MKIKLKIERDSWHAPHVKVVHLKESQPFFLNPRGLLVHRVRSAVKYYRHGKLSHIAVHYICNNVTTADGPFLARPPKDRLLCSHCERIALEHGLPSADKLAGRHVHIGRLRVQQVCCTEQREAN